MLSLLILHETISFVLHGPFSFMFVIVASGRSVLMVKFLPPSVKVKHYLCVIFCVSFLLSFGASVLTERLCLHREILLLVFIQNIVIFCPFKCQMSCSSAVFASFVVSSCHCCPRMCRICEHFSV